MSIVLDREALAQCRRALAKGSRSFNLAAKLLPPDVRDAVAVVYAWCRRCDDAVDEVPPSQQMNALHRLHREVEAIYAGALMNDEVLAAFQNVVQYFGIPRVYVDELIMGLAMDAGNVRYSTREQLLLYCYRVAGVVGLMMCHILGINDSAMLDRAAHLGIAMQLTNICRDVAEDWQRGRRYVPGELLPAPAVQPAGATPFPNELAPDYVAPTRQLLEEAARYYASADHGIMALGLRSGLSIRVARHVYAAIGEVIAARGYDVTRGRAVVGTGRKLVLLARALLAATLEIPRRLKKRAQLAAPRHTVRFEDAVISA